MFTCKMKSLYKYSVLFLILKVLLFCVVLFRRHINYEYKTKDATTTSIKEEDFEAGLWHGIAALQIEQAMAERKPPPLRPHLMPENQIIDPKKILIVATWRTGSSFLGDIIQSSPGVFYSFEPLIALKGHSKIEMIHNLYQCKFRSDYLQHISGENADSVEFMSRNKRVWEACSKQKDLCTSPEFVSRLCVHFPVRLIKVVRLRLSELVKERMPSNLKVVYLARDPRGVMASRSNLTWCQRDPECNSPGRLCDSVMSDLKLIRKLAGQEPDRYYFLKFEDLSANVEVETEKLFKFLGLKVTLPVKVFLNTHTRGSRGNNATLKSDPFSTKRQSDKVAYEWRKKLPKDAIKSLSNVCLNVINYLNYPL